MGGDKGEGGDKGGEAGATRWVRRKGTRGLGVRRGVPGARMSPGNPPHARGVTCVSRLANGGLGGQGG